MALLNKKQWEILWEDTKQIEKYLWYLPEKKRRPSLQHLYRIKELIQSVFKEIKFLEERQIK